MWLYFERLDPRFSCVTSAALNSERWNFVGTCARTLCSARASMAWKGNLRRARGANKGDAKVGGEADRVRGGGREGLAS